MGINLILFAFSTIGATLIVVDGSIMQWFRDLIKNFANKINKPLLGTLVDCYLCSGFWCGGVMAFILITWNPFQVFACGCAGAFLSHFAVSFIDLIQASTMMNLPEEKK